MEQATLINKLCHRVEEAVSLSVKTPKQFEQLAMRIFERTGTLLSTTTLKRLWGYLNEDTNPRKSTLDVLAQCCGWRSFDDFAAGNVPEIESGFVCSQVLNVDKELVPGDVVRLIWAPARVCMIRYLGNSRWVVVDSEGTRLAPGDTFTCPMIVAGEPLYLDNLVHAGMRPGVYVCGRRSGITFLRENSNQ